MSPDHPLIPITIYASLLCYVLAAGCWVSKHRGQSYRGIWTAGCLLMWAHAISAFHFYHNWSHQHAVELTAKETELIIGVAMGEGIWFSYGLLVLWLIDVVWCWVKREPTIAQAWFTAMVHAYAFFILFNGTVIFEEGTVRLGGVIGTIWLVRMAWRFRGFRVGQAIG